MADHGHCSNWAATGLRRVAVYRPFHPDDHRKNARSCRDRPNRQGLSERGPPGEVSRKRAVPARWPETLAQCRSGTRLGVVEGTTEKPAVRRLS